VHSVSTIQKVLGEFESLSGLKANLDKSTCFCVGGFLLWFNLRFFLN
jgi:hypothetical protein